MTRDGTFLLIRAESAHPDASQVAYIYGQLAGLEGEALARGGSVFVNIDTPGGARPMIEVRPDAGVSLFILEPAAERGEYRFDARAAATILAAS